MTDEQRKEFKELILEQIEEVREENCDLEEMTKPIPPDNALGRLTRMDALGSKSVNEAVLENKRMRLNALEGALARCESGSYGICTNCGEEIPFGRLVALPHSSRCIKCVHS
jgi:DnaK suppressor protein